MSITRLQQARQMYAMGQRVAKTMDGSRPGYRGDDEYQGGRGYGGSKASTGGDKGTGGSKGNLGGGGGGQNSAYRSYSPPTKKTYTSETIDSKPVTGDDYRRSRDNFVNTLNRNNQIRAQQTGTRFTPYQGGARTTDYYNPNPLKGLLKLAAGFAIPGAGFLINQGGRLKDGLMSLNDKIQNSNFGRSTSLMDYLDMKKYGGYDERERARRINMDESKNLQARIDAGDFDGSFRNTVGTTPTLDINNLETGDLNNLASLIEASEQPQGIVFNNPVGGVDQYAKEMEALESKISPPLPEYGLPGLSYDIPINEMGGTLQQYYTQNPPDKKYLTKDGNMQIYNDGINFNDGSSQDIIGIDRDGVPTDEEIAILRGYQ